MKPVTKKRNEHLRYRYRQLQAEGIIGKKRFEILQDEFFLSHSQICGILFSRRLKNQESAK